MREQIRKKIKNEDLYEGCREAFKNGWQRVKLYFLCGLPGEREVDLDGIVDMAETISRIGKEVTGRYVEVTASVSNFVPKPHTPYQWNGMQTREYLQWAGQYLRSGAGYGRCKIKQHDIEMQPAGRRADARRPARRRGPGGSLAARLPARRLDASASSRRCGGRPSPTWASTPTWYSQRHRPMTEVLPWDHVNVKKGPGVSGEGAESQRRAAAR